MSEATSSGLRKLAIWLVRLASSSRSRRAASGSLSSTR
jgi:hypothetical protein